ncbi:hypothetical protein BH23ACT6_BH23ACT6_16290 [soil metagenome]
MIPLVGGPMVSMSRLIRSRVDCDLVTTSRDLGDDEVEEEVKGTFAHSMQEGSERLHRSTRVMLTTGFAGAPAPRD